MTEYKIKPVEEMSVEELIGQVIMVGLPGLSLDSHYAEFIKEYKIGNYILFARNYRDTKQMKAFMSELYSYTAKETGSFPLVSIDQEGGMVVRLFKDVTFPASPLTTAATTVPNAPYETGAIIGRDMLKMGINFNLAPCLEINEGLSNPLINIRGYGATKEAVLKHATAFVRGVQSSGALSCIKHFPGAGSSTKDSHLELPIIEDPKEQLLNYNMYPFVHLLESDALMTSHCLYKSFDSLPSTLSRVLLTEVLRDSVGFEGLIVSDGMEMKAIADHYGIGQGCVMALSAGCDILLLCHEYTEQKEAFECVIKAVEKGELSVESLREKVSRINKAKEKLIKGLSLYFTDDDYVVQKDEHALMQSIVDNSYTHIKGVKPHVAPDTLILTAGALVSSIVEDEFDERNLTKALRNAFPDNDVIEFTKDKGFTADILEKAKNYGNILIYSYDAYKDEVQKETINGLLKTDKEVCVVSIKGPIDRSCFEGLENYSCLYEYTPNSIRAAVKQLKGEIDLCGRLPE
ncbi:MAG: hypothetical protein IKK83_01715 [Clostridia bacterium]|nr:hypothetical protein [Clostridia bacterium]